MRTALGVCAQANFCGLQETHGSLPNAIEFARLAGGSRCFSAWSAVGCEVVDFMDERLVFGSASAPGVGEHGVPLIGEEDTGGLENGVLGHNDSVCSDESSESENSEYSSATQKSDNESASSECSSSSSHISNSSGGVFSCIKRETFSALATCKHWAIVPGRCLISEVSDGNQSTIFINMHFYNFTQNDTNKIHDFINQKTILPNRIRSTTSSSS